MPLRRLVFLVPVLCGWLSATADAAISHTQKCTNYGAGSATTITCSLTTVAAGSTLVAVAGWTGATTLTSIANTQDGTFTVGRQDNGTADSTQSNTAIAYVTSTAGCSGANCMTFTVTYSAGSTRRLVTVHELTGVAAIGNSTGTFNAAFGTGTDACSSGTFTTTADGAFIAAICFAGEGWGNVSLGTTVAGGGTWTLGGGSGGASACASPSGCTEYAIQTSASASSTGVFTLANSLDSAAVSAMAFEASVAGGVTPKGLLLGILP